MLLFPFVLYEYAFLFEDGGEGFEENLYIQREADRAYVLDVERKAVVPEKRIAAVDGGVAGDTGLHGKLQMLVARVELGLAAQVGARAHHAHVPFEHVEELGHLVERRLAHERSHARHARVVGAVVRGAVGHEQIGRVYLHGTELVHGELAAVLAHARCVVEHGPFVLVGDHGPHDRDEHEHEGERRDADGDVAGALAHAQVGSLFERRVLVGASTAFACCP